MLVRQMNCCDDDRNDFRSSPVPRSHEVRKLQWTTDGPHAQHAPLVGPAGGCRSCRASPGLSPSAAYIGKMLNLSRLHHPATVIRLRKVNERWALQPDFASTNRTLGSRLPERFDPPSHVATGQLSAWSIQSLCNNVPLRSKFSKALTFCLSFQAKLAAALFPNDTQRLLRCCPFMSWFMW